MIKVAITGNIASGKSLVQKILEEKGFKVYDADKIGHKMLECNKKAVIEAFSDFDILENNKISRQKLGKLVFGNENLRKQLENIIHPEIKKEILKIFEQNKEEQIVFVGIPLLFEAKMESLFDKVIVVCTEEDLRIERIIKRDNLSREDALKRVNSQMPQSEKIKLSDFVVENNTNIKELELNIEKVLELL